MWAQYVGNATGGAFRSCALTALAFPANNIVGKASADAVSRELIEGPHQWFQGQGEGPPASM